VPLPIAVKKEKTMGPIVSCARPAKECTKKGQEDLSVAREHKIEIELPDRRKEDQREQRKKYQKAVGGT